MATSRAQKARKKAYVGEWTENERQNTEVIAELKKEIKELSAKLTFINNIDSKKYSTDPHEVVRKIPYPPGAKTAEEAIEIYNIKLIDLQKQKDLMSYKTIKRKKDFDKLVEQYNELLISKTESQDNPSAETPAATIEEHVIKKRVCHLENEIHKINVQWMEAEHIRKKYKSIKGSLTADSDKFEKSLLELEQAIEDQQVDINKMQVINQDALQMRDSTKILLHKQEHTANSFAKMRDRQEMDLKRQVEDRKSELERLERKLFSAGKVIIHQGSTESLSTEQHNEKVDNESDPNVQAQKKSSELEGLFKGLMITTGATSADEVLERFISQKESSSRLNYLRSVTEEEKKNLEIQREMLLSQLDSLKFSDVKENEVNQEQVEQLKTQIVTSQTVTKECLQATEQITNVIEHIRITLIDLILRLQEIDESLMEFSDTPTKHQIYKQHELEENISNETLLNVLEEKIKRALSEIRQIAFEKENGPLDEALDVISKVQHIIKPTTPSSRPSSTLEDKERPQPYPSCYATLITSRTTGQISAGSPGQVNQPVGTDDEGDVPSRQYLKRQAGYIVDSKSRRKGFRVPRR